MKKCCKNVHWVLDNKLHCYCDTSAYLETKAVNFKLFWHEEYCNFAKLVIEFYLLAFCLKLRVEGTLLILILNRVTLNINHHGITIS